MKKPPASDGFCPGTTVKIQIVKPPNSTTNQSNLTLQREGGGTKYTIHLKLGSKLKFVTL